MRLKVSKKTGLARIRQASAIGLGDALDKLLEEAKSTLDSLGQDKDVERQALVELRNMIQALGKMDKGLTEMSQAWRTVQQTHKSFDKGYVSDEGLNKAFKDLEKIAFPHLD
jgi:SRSO17 transposase